MNKEMVMDLINAHNDSIDHFIHGELAEKLNAKNGKIRMVDWFKAQTLIDKQGFYEKGKAILDVCRACGYDVKMNMQSNELVYYGRL